MNKCEVVIPGSGPKGEDKCQDAGDNQCIKLANEKVAGGNLDSFKTVIQDETAFPDGQLVELSGVFSPRHTDCKALRKVQNCINAELTKRMLARRKSPPPTAE